MKRFWAASSFFNTRTRLLLSKRTKVAICAILATFLAWIVLSQTGWLFGIFFVITITATFGLILWVLAEDLAGIKFLTIPALPVFYLGAFLGLAKSLVLSPVGIFTAGLALGTSFYFLLLTQNIYNIAAARSIGLVRAANVSGTLFTVIAAFLAYGIVWVSGLPFWILVPAVFLISFILSALSIWSTHLEEKISWLDFKVAILLSLILAQIALALSFWPILSLIGALVLSIALYVALSLTQFELQERLSNRVIAEYLLIGVVVLVLILVTTRWGG